MELNETPNLEQVAVISSVYVKNWDGMKFSETSFWRRGRDSNPRYGYPYAAFRVRCIQPLCHLSAVAKRDIRLIGRVFYTKASGRDKLAA
jgi:hypothetical protein